MKHLPQQVLMPLSPELAKRLAETSSWYDLTEEEQDALTMAWLQDEGRLDLSEITNAVPVEELENDETPSKSRSARQSGGSRNLIWLSRLGRVRCL